MQLVTSDAHAGLKDAIAANLPGAVWQRCRTHSATNLMSVTPKSMWPAVKAMLHSVYDQPDAAAVNAQFDRTLDYVTEKLPAVATHLDTARTDILAQLVPQRPLAADLVEQPQRAPQPGDPSPHRQRRHLPNRDAIIRLVGGVLAEQTDEWAEGRRYLGLDILARSRTRSTTNTGSEADPDTIMALTA